VWIIAGSEDVAAAAAAAEVEIPADAEGKEAKGIFMLFLS